MPQGHYSLHGRIVLVLAASSAKTCASVLGKPQGFNSCH